MANGGLLLSARKLSDADRAAREKLVEAGNAAFDEDNYEYALECYHRAAVLDGSDPGIWASLGLAFSNLDFPHEAWRSYKLALTVDPDHTNTLWYAAEFLEGVEDYQLAALMLERYLKLENNPQRRAEAEELLKEVGQHLPDDAGEPLVQRRRLAEDLGESIPEPNPAASFDDDDEDEEDALEFVDEEAGFDDEDEDFDDEDLAGEYEELDDEAFVASLVLQLNGMDARCGSCNTAIPMDAPYCYNCKSIHFYRD